jgi:hypothetical protein
MIMPPVNNLNGNLVMKLEGAGTNSSWALEDRTSSRSRQAMVSLNNIKPFDHLKLNILVK